MCQKVWPLGLTPVIAKHRNGYFHRQEKLAGQGFRDTLEGMTGDIRRLFGEEILNFKLRLLNLNQWDARENRPLATNPILFALANVWNLGDGELDNLFRLCKDVGKEKGARGPA